MKSKLVLLSALFFCMGASDLLYARGHHHHSHRKHRPHYSHGRIYMARPNFNRPRVQVYQHGISPSATIHCHDRMC